MKLHLKLHFIRLPSALVLFICNAASALEIAGAPAAVDGPAVGRPINRQLMSFEVELVVITGDADKTGLGRWATLAAAGYRVSQVTLDSGKQWIYLERPFIGDSSKVRLPAIVEQDVPTAEALRAKILQAENERAQALRAQFPVGGSAVPVPAPKSTE